MGLNLCCCHQGDEKSCLGQYKNEIDRLYTYIQYARSNSVRSCTRSYARSPENTLDHALDHSITHSVTRPNTPDHALDHTQKNARSRTRSLAHALDHSKKYARSHTRSRDNTLDLALDLSIAHSITHSTTRSIGRRVWIVRTDSTYGREYAQLILSACRVSTVPAVGARRRRVGTETRAMRPVRCVCVCDKDGGSYRM